jgi:hypothetical protein
MSFGFYYYYFQIDIVSLGQKLVARYEIKKNNNKSDDNGGGD